MNNNISLDTAYQKYISGVPVIDVRSPAEFQAERVTGAINIPLQEITSEEIASRFGDKEVLIICQAGSRGEMACKKIFEGGCVHAINIEGGTLAWKKAQYPIETFSSVISIDRQVRIAAGSLVITGILLSYILQQQQWLLLSFFVGAGLIYAGISNSCGLALLLAKMPWNK